MVGKLLLAASLATGLAIPAHAAEFRTVTQRAAFLDLVEGKRLTRLGIRLDVLPSGGIRGRAFGRQVTGGWTWDGGYFCREMVVGGSAVERNCQVVQVKGDTVRFIADRGAGESADLVLR